MMHQFADLGLNSVVVPARPIGLEKLEQWRTDWNIDTRIRIDVADTAGLRKAGASAAAPLLLIAPTGQIVASWQFPVAPADVWLQIQSHLGTPAGAQQLPSCQNALAH
jgi:hypothetical protein